jgi:hypothetical protein
MIRRLSDLVAPLSEREFLDCFSRKRRLVVKTTKPERSALLLPWATINRLIANVMPSSNIMVKLKGRTVDELMYRSGPEGRLRPDALQHLAAQGVSIVLNHIHRYVPPIKALAHAIERRLGHPVHVLLHYFWHRQCLQNPRRLPRRISRSDPRSQTLAWLRYSNCFPARRFSTNSG